MHPSAFVLFSCLACVALVSGCATTPTPQQELMAASGLRIATVAYVTRGRTAAEQAKRADQIGEITGMVRNHIVEAGHVVVSLDALAAMANARIMASDLSAGDKQLAQAIVSEALFLAEDQAKATGLNIGAENARLVLYLVGEIERAAGVFDRVSPA